MSLPLEELLQVLGALAPLHLAEDWDNVGLLIDPRLPSEDLDVARLMLTIDASPSVVAEATHERVQCLVSYHPPLFRAKKRYSRALDPILFAAARAPFAVYSPHTALDAAARGLTDWLAEAAGAGKSSAVIPAAPSRAAATEQGAGEEPSVPVAARALEGTPVGAGRLLELDEPSTVENLVERLKRHLGLSHVRLALSARHGRGELVRRVAFCAGSGGSLFERVQADLYVTGELGHHAVLTQLAAGNSVILCEHSNTERGFLPRFREQLLAATAGRVQVLISAIDREPLLIV